MPELPEAETIARQLQAALAGRAIGAVRHLRADMVHGAGPPAFSKLHDLRVIAVRRRAKRVVFDLGRKGSPPGASITFHLGMSGRLTVCQAAEPVEDHTHLRLCIGGGEIELRFRDPRRFGGIWIDTPGADRSNPAGQAEGRSGGPENAVRKRRLLGPVGPEPLELKPRVFREILRRKRQVKALLLDQTAIAGLGNIYCDEALHDAGIHPLTRADRLNDEQALRLLGAIKATLRRAIRFKGSTLMDYRSPGGERGLFQRHHRVYDREGQPCRNCGRTISRIQVAGRSSFICTRCQPRPRSRNRRGNERARTQARGDHAPPKGYGSAGGEPAR